MNWFALLSFVARMSFNSFLLVNGEPTFILESGFFTVENFLIHFILECTLSQYDLSLKKSVSDFPLI